MEPYIGESVRARDKLLWLSGWSVDQKSDSQPEEVHKMLTTLKLNVLTVSSTQHKDSLDACNR
jgi:hypothetical protein